MPASQTLSGTGNPNGVVDGNPGDTYQDQTGKLWVNTAAPSTWVQLATGTASGPVFQWDEAMAWAPLYTQMSALPGPKICLVEWDEATSGIRTMTNNGGVPTDLNEILFMGFSGMGGNALVTISVDDGFLLATMTENAAQVARLSSQNVNWTFNNTVTAVVTPNPLNNDYASLNVNGGTLGNNGTQPIIRGATILVLQDGAKCNGSIAEFTDNNNEIHMSGDSDLAGGVFSGGGFPVGFFTDATCTWAAGNFTGPVYTPVNFFNNQLNVPGDDIIPVRLPDITNVPGTSIAMAVETTAQKAFIVDGDTGKASLEANMGDVAFPTVFAHGGVGQLDAAVRISDIQPGGFGFRIDAPFNGGIQVNQRMPADPNEWGIFEMPLVAQLGARLNSNPSVLPGLQQGTIVTQTLTTVATPLAAGPGTLSIGGFAFGPGGGAGVDAHAGAVIFVSNYGGTADLILLHENAATPAENRIRLPGSVDFHVVPNKGVWLTAQPVQGTALVRWFLLSS